MARASAAACGAGEILGLRWVDLDVDLDSDEPAAAGVLTVVGQRDPVLERGAGARGAEDAPRDPAGAGAADRGRPRSRRTGKRQAAERLAAGPVWEDSGHVVDERGRGRSASRGALSRAWQAWADAPGWRTRGTHAGRHYAASTLLASGQASVADVAGRSSATTRRCSLNTYAVAVTEGQVLRRTCSARQPRRRTMRRQRVRANAQIVLRRLDAVDADGRNTCGTALPGERGGRLRDPLRPWGSRGRRFKSCQPDGHRRRSGAVSGFGDGPFLVRWCN